MDQLKGLINPTGKEANMEVKRTERGWIGHFICADRCRFRRNTLLEYNDIKIVVSSVGLMESSWKKGDKYYRGPFEEIGLDRYFETMVFHSKSEDTRYHDIDVSRQIYFTSPWCISELDADDKANEMHDAVVEEISTRLLAGEKFEQKEEVY